MLMHTTLDATKKVDMLTQDLECTPAPEQPETAADPTLYKRCAHCCEWKKLSEFLRRTGRRSGQQSRRGACRECRKQRKLAAVLHAEEGGEEHPAPHPANLLPIFTNQSDAIVRPAAITSFRTNPKLPAEHEEETPEDIPAPPKIRTKRPLPAPPPRPEGPDASVLRPNRNGIIRMRGKTDKGRSWHQETDLETAVVLVKEFAAIVVNRYTVRRIYTNKSFRSYILTRDQYTCFFCGEYGDTIDHLLPRAKGGHTTPVNCVCACNECNQSKADRDLDDFV